MRFLIATILATLISTSALAQTAFDPSTVEFPWKNGPTRDATIDLNDLGNSVFVFEAFANFCGACAENASNVDALATEFADDDRVQVMDLGLDDSEREYAAWIRAHNPNHPVVEDVGEAVWNSLSQSNYIPQVFVTDCEGTLLYSHVGGWNRTVKNEIRAAIADAKEVTCD
jgi:hypothetical protein